MEAKPGTYILILNSNVRTKVQVGRWGELDVRLGYYLYVGSAFGPGGIRARVSRHVRMEKAMRWHVDYLREVTELQAIWFSYTPRQLEHEWARTLAGLPGLSPVRGFGSSDCTCEAHLFFGEERPGFSVFLDAVGGEVQVRLEN